MSDDLNEQEIRRRAQLAALAKLTSVSPDELATRARSNDDPPELARFLPPGPTDLNNRMVRKDLEPVPYIYVENHNGGYNDAGASLDQQGRRLVIGGEESSSADEMSRRKAEVLYQNAKRTPDLSPIEVEDAEERFKDLNPDRFRELIQLLKGH